MSQRLAQGADKFRSVFKLIDKDCLQWFPGHMGKGLKQMQNKLRTVDLIVEVHDARIPLSGKNEEFKYKIGGIKPHILVLNKVDMIDESLIPSIIAKLRPSYPNIIFTNCKDHTHQGVGKLFPLAQELINKSERYNRVNEEDYAIMIIGIPNVGKSSLTNCLRNRFLGKPNASAVGANPGITRSVLEKIKICEKPLFYMLDTPGILNPTISNLEVGLKLALCNTIKDHLVGYDIIADYLLFWLNKHEKFEYVSILGLKEPSDSILEVLSRIALIEKKLLRIRNANNEYVYKPDFNLAAQILVKKFREGQLGKIVLDEALLR